METDRFSFDEIMEALQRQEFFLEYLPTMRLSDGHCVGGEALIRWRHGDRIVPPMDFIPFIENTSLSGLITYRVGELVGRELGPWLHRQEDIHIAINVPPETIGRGNLWSACTTFGLGDIFDKLMIEVNERGFPDLLAMETLKKVIAKHKVKIALDDVNINDANLLVMLHLQVDVVKLEKSFADEMLREDWSDEKMAGIAALIHAGRFAVIAEGVETARQVEILQAAGVQMAQGWYFSHALPAADFMNFFSAHQH